MKTRYLATSHTLIQLVVLFKNRLPALNSRACTITHTAAAAAAAAATPQTDTHTHAH